MHLIFALLLSVVTGKTLASSEFIYEAQKKNIQLTDKDKETLEIGEISTTRYVVGGIFGTYPGFGIGHAIQGRWSEQGQIFTWSQLGSVAAIVVGASSCADGDEWGCSDVEESLIVLGALGYLGFRIWEIVDVWATPPSHNSKHRKLQNYIENAKSEAQIKSSLNLVPILSPRFGQGLGINYIF